MQQILTFLVQHCAFLWADARYRITDSEVATSFGGDAFVVIESEHLRLRIVRDRGQLMMDAQSPRTGKPRSWHTTDLLQGLLAGTRPPSSLLEPATAEFLRVNLAELEARFGDPDRLAETERELHLLSLERSDEMFPPARKRRRRPPGG